MNRFAPKLDILPSAQRALWAQLRPLRRAGFVLYGDTALALRLGHRESIDFDFFSARELDREKLFAVFPSPTPIRVLQDEPDTITLSIGAGDSRVKVSVFARLSMGRVGLPEESDDEVAIVASLDDLAATKIKVLLQRVEVKDYLDVVALLRAGFPLERMLAGAAALFAPTFSPFEALKALTYFQDSELDRLTIADRAFLQQRAAECGNIPSLPVLGRDLAR